MFTFDHFWFVWAKLSFMITQSAFFPRKKSYLGNLSRWVFLKEILINWFYNTISQRPKPWYWAVVAYSFPLVNQLFGLLSFRWRRPWHSWKLNTIGSSVIINISGEGKEIAVAAIFNMALILLAWDKTYHTVISK